MKCGERGKELIKLSEGLRLKAYLDAAAVWTIGYGHTGADVIPNLVITEEEANVILENDILEAEICVNRKVSVPLNQNQFDALVDFVFNLGCSRFSGSTLLRLLNTADYQRAAWEFEKWNKAAGRVLEGLVVRRKRERTLFEMPL